MGSFVWLGLLSGSIFFGLNAGATFSESVVLSNDDTSQTSSPWAGKNRKGIIRIGQHLTSALHAKLVRPDAEVVISRSCRVSGVPICVL